MVAKFPPSDNPPAPFSGYGHPRFTQIPDAFIDKQMQDMTGAEVKVMLYIFRRTYGFQKDHDADAISYSQLLYGITRRDGHQLDRGAGVSSGNLAKTLEALETRGLIFRHRRFAEDGGKLATVYELNIYGTPRYTDDPDVRVSVPQEKGLRGPTSLSDAPPTSESDVPSTSESDDTPPSKTDGTRNRKNQHTVLQHTHAPEPHEEVCVTEQEQEPIPDNLIKAKSRRGPFSVSLSNTRQEAPERVTMRGRAQNRTPRVEMVHSASDGPHTPIAHALEASGVAPSDARKLAATLRTQHHGVDFVQRWQTWIASQEKIANPAAYLATMIAKNVEPPTSPITLSEPEAIADKYLNGKYAALFNRKDSRTVDSSP